MADAERITGLADVTEFPLCWPPDKPRASQRRLSQFRTTVPKAQREIEVELRRWKVIDHVISMAPPYRRGPIDPAVAVWWSAPGGKSPRDQLRVLACDSYIDQGANLHAIALTLEGLRAFERYGTYGREQAIEGARLALPRPPGDEIDWPTVLGVERNWPLSAIEAVWRTKAEKAHPDRGGAPGEMARLNAAMQAARQELR